MSKQKLIEDLERKPKDPFRDKMLEEVKNDLFHDYKSPYDFPKIVLIEALTKYGYRDLARKAARGEYDDKAPEAEMKAEDPEMQARFERAQALAGNDPIKFFEIMSEGYTPQQKAMMVIETGFGIPVELGNRLEAAAAQPGTTKEMLFQMIVDHFTPKPAEASSETNDDVVNYDELKIGQPIDEFEVVSWCPTNDLTTPPTQVHLLLKLPPFVQAALPGIERFAIRIKSRQGAENLCADIMKRAQEVWPDVPKS